MPLGARAVLACLLVPALAAAVDVPVPRPRPEAKTDYRVYLLARERSGAAPTDRADPIWGLVADLSRQIESMGATVEKKGTFTTPTTEGGQRDNEVTVLRAVWTPEQLAKVRALTKDIDLVRVRIEPAAAPVGAASAKGVPPSAAQEAARRVRAQLAFAVPPDLLSGAGARYDGSRTRDAVADDFTAAATRLGVPVASLPKDPAELARRLKAQPAPPKAPAVGAVPAPVAAGSLPFDAHVAAAAARTGVDPDVLRSLIFAANGYAGGFARTTGLHGPMGLSQMTGRDHGLDRRSIDDPASNIAVGADYFSDLQRMFGGDLSRAVAAFYCGSGTVRRSRGIPAECQGFLSQFYLAYQNGTAWAIDHNAPRQKRPVVPQKPVSVPAAVGRAAREDVVSAVKGDTPPNRAWTSRRLPQALIDKAYAAAADNPFSATVRLDPNIFLGLLWAEGGYSADNKKPNAWGAVGPAQVTYSGAAPHCREVDAKGKSFYDWKGISKWDGRKNVDCGAKVYYDRIHWTAAKDPIIGLALYNTQQKHWQRIISRNQVPPFPETVYYVVRAAHVACSRTGTQLLTPEHFEGARAQQLARAAERNLERNEFPYEKIDVDPSCTVFRR